ncbi:hypothetical protein TSAR_009430 [Trichomalopsis sarcophagae]|uniref:Uncharacterized protein n=1 Tax=Trichomalopsis sarcophagae TaxID=543379 RepID=A0A232EDM1_9HYME|nr:hypothetical protein TSAR_009430 [Trichomalopsis sarcophagae]
MLEEMRALVPVYRQSMDVRREKCLKRTRSFDIASDCFSEPFVRLGLVHVLIKTVNRCVKKINAASTCTNIDRQNQFFFAMARKILEENAAIITLPLMQLSAKEFISVIRVVSDGCVSRAREPPRQDRTPTDSCMICACLNCEKFARKNVTHLAWRRKNAKLDEDVADALAFDNRLCSEPHGDPVFFNFISPEDMKTILTPADKDQLTNRKYVFLPM